MAHKFVNQGYTGIDANGATEDTSYDLGAIFWNQAKELIFRIGNTGSSTTDYQLSASGLNSGILGYVEFSDDHDTWSETLTMSGVAPNRITDTLYCRFTCPDDAYVASGTFLIRVDEV